MKKRLSLIPILLLLLSASAFGQKADPASTVRSFYKFHLSQKGIFNAEEVSALKKWFSPELNALLQTELDREKEYIKANPTDKPHFGDGFPFQPLNECASKDGKAVRNVYSVRNVKTSGDGSTVEIRFSEPKACGGKLIGTTNVSLIKTTTGWLIDDMKSSDGYSLITDLKRKDY